MIILPSKEYNNPTNEKITTYQFLSNVGCPVFDSVLFDENEPITKEAIRDYFKSVSHEFDLKSEEGLKKYIQKQLAC